jgi:hypothetical protein
LLILLDTDDLLFWYGLAAVLEQNWLAWLEAEICLGSVLDYLTLAWPIELDNTIEIHLQDEPGQARNTSITGSYPAQFRDE